jgi:hypothetical protein
MAPATQAENVMRALGQSSRVSGLFTRLFMTPLALMGSADQVPIGPANLVFQPFGGVS